LIIVVDSIQREESARIEITGKSRAGREKKKRQTTVKENDLSDHFLRFSTNNWVLASLRE